MKILSLINKIHQIYPSADLNSILDLASKKIGFVEYSILVSDNDLVHGLILILENDVNFSSSPSGYYGGSLV